MGIVPSQGRSAGIDLTGLLGRLAGPIGQLLKGREPPSPFEEVRLRLALLELAKASNGGVVAYRDVGDLRMIIEPERQDIVFAGKRGGGKTASACRIAQDLSKALNQPVMALGWQQKHAEALGFVPTKQSVETMRDCVCVIDEAGLRIKPGKRDEALAEAVALGRHYGVSLLWCSQSGAGVHRDVLRQDVRLAWLEVDPIQARFDREEIADLLAQVVSIQGTAQPWPKGRVVTRQRNEWVVGQLPLPDGWTEDVSKLWRK